MLKTFKTKFLMAPVLAGALAVTTVSAPAQADTDDTVRAIAGIAALALLIGAANNNNNNNKSNKAVTTYSRPNTNTNNNRVYGTINPAPNWSSPKAAKRRALPDRCIRSVTTRQGIRTVYGQRCLQQNYSFASFLPDNCRVNIRTANNRLRPAYVTQCLRRDGWKVHQGRNHPRFASND